MLKLRIYGMGFFPAATLLAAVALFFLLPACRAGAAGGLRTYESARPNGFGGAVGESPVVVERLAGAERQAAEGESFRGEALLAAAGVDDATGGVLPESGFGGEAGEEAESAAVGGKAPEPGEEWRNRVLRVALSGPYEPFLFIDDSGEPGGFDLDIALALCAELGGECRFVNERFGAIIPALVNGEYDFAVAGFSVTAEREQLVDFTRRYFISYSVFIGAPGKVEGVAPEQLAGKRLGTQQGSVQADYLRQSYPASKLILAGTFAELTAMLRSGEIDLALVEGLPAYAFLKSPAGRDFETVGDPLGDGALSAQASIAVNKRNKGLKEELDRALERVYASGEYERINRKYFDFTIY